MKKLILMGLLCSSLVFCQSANCQRILGSDTLHVLFTYSDTSCHFNKGSVQSIYNSHCMKQDSGYVVMWMYITEFLDKNKKPFGKNIDIWFYKLK